MLLARRFAARFAPVLTLCLLLLSATGGCSRDIHVFRSTTNSPKNIAVVSAETGETLWSINVPAGQQLRLDFGRGEEKDENRGSPDVPAKTMQWELYTLDAVSTYNQEMKGGERLDGDTIDLPGQETILKMTLIGADSEAGR